MTAWPVVDDERRALGPRTRRELRSQLRKPPLADVQARLCRGDESLGLPIVLGAVLLGVLVATGLVAGGVFSTNGCRQTAQTTTQTTDSHRPKDTEQAGALTTTVQRTVTVSTPSGSTASRAPQQSVHVMRAAPGRPRRPLDSGSQVD